MAGTTDRFGLNRMSSGDKFSDQSYKYTNADRAKIDTLLYVGTTGHHHDGQTGAAVSPTQGLTLVLDTTSGAIPAGTRVYYKYTLVDLNGNETAASPESWIETAQSLATPSAPTLVANSGSGVLTPGNYYYILSVYEDTSSQETLALSPNWITVRASASSVTLTMPTLPTGATGFNIYRKRPGDFTYFFLDSTTDATYEDDGGTDASSTRILPTTNNTNASNAVDISFPGASPTVPDGYTWKLYRTYAAGNYQNSLVHHVVEETSSGSGIISPTYQDLGGATLTGEPPTQSFGFDSPDKVDLTDMNEVQGFLPVGGVHVHPMQIELTQRGHLSDLVTFDSFPFSTGHEPANFPLSTDGDMKMVSFPGSYAMGVMAYMNTPPAGDMQIDVKVIHPNQATPTSDRLVAIQWEAGVLYYNLGYGDFDSPTPYIFTSGDVLVLAVSVVDSGATPVAADLTVTVYGFCYFTSTVTSFPVPWS